MKIWSVYLLRNEKGHLYTGISTDPERRLEEHRGKMPRGAKYTRGCKSLEMVFCCRVGSRGMALRLENRIKKLPKTKKEALVKEKPDRVRLFERFDIQAAESSDSVDP